MKCCVCGAYFEPFTEDMRECEMCFTCWNKEISIPMQEQQRYKEDKNNV